MTESNGNAKGNPVRTAWGRARFGARTVPAMVPAVPVGILLAALVAAAAALAGAVRERRVRRNECFVAACVLTYQARACRPAAETPHSAERSAAAQDRREIEIDSMENGSRSAAV